MIAAVGSLDPCRRGRKASMMKSMRWTVFAVIAAVLSGKPGQAATYAAANLKPTWPRGRSVDLFRRGGTVFMMRTLRWQVFTIILFTLSLSLPVIAQAQPWSGIISPNRAIDWSKAGLPATLPDGETTPNPWTPPTRTQCGPILSPLGSGQDDSSNINSALQSCAAGHYVLLGPGTFTITSGIMTCSGNGGCPVHNVTLRGSGASSTHLSGTGGISIGHAWGAVQHN